MVVSTSAACQVGRPSKAFSIRQQLLLTLLVGVASLTTGGAAIYKWTAYPLARPIGRLSLLLRKVIELPGCTGRAGGQSAVCCAE